jgi:integrase/recombinase XerD
MFKMEKYYYSIYGPFIEQYIATKKSLGFKFKDSDSILSRFDRMAQQSDETEIGISKKLAEKWSKKNLNETEINRYKRIQALRLFSLFLCKIGYPSYVPKLPKLKSTFIPYIFTKEEIATIFSVCDGFKRYHHNKSAIFIVPALLRLLYGTGLRLGEALALGYDDVNLKDEYLVVRHSKNGKDRIVPITGSLTEVCRQYVQYRNTFSSYAYAKPDRFFVYPNGDNCSGHAVYNWFRKALHKAGISHGGRGSGPRVHDLRHTFSVHALASMAETGMDLYYSLPILSVYLGHQTLAATDGYVRLTAQMYPSVIAAANNISNNLFPDIINFSENETN